MFQVVRFDATCFNVKNVMKCKPLHLCCYFLLEWPFWIWVLKYNQSFFCQNVRRSQFFHFWNVHEHWNLRFSWKNGLYLRTQTTVEEQQNELSGSTLILFKFTTDLTCTSCLVSQLLSGWRLLLKLHKNLCDLYYYLHTVEIDQESRLALAS